MRYIWLLLAAIFCVAPAHAQQTGRRVALVVGNAQYASGERLPNAANDAQLIADTLRRTGFEVSVLTNANRSNLLRALEDLQRRADGAEVAALYFSGHGLSFEGANWLLPVDASLQKPQDLAFQAVSVELVQGALTRAKLGLLILDACRMTSYPQGWGETRGLNRGLAAQQPPRNVQVVYSAAPNRVAMDGSGRNSPFAQALARRLPEPGLDIRFALNRVSDDVVQHTGGAQQPYVMSSLSGVEITLVPTPSAPASGPPTPTPVIVEIGRAQPRISANGGSAILLLTPQTSRDRAAAICEALWNMLGTISFEDTRVGLGVQVGVRREEELLRAYRPLYWLTTRMTDPNAPARAERCADRLAAYDYARSRIIREKYGLTGDGPHLLVTRADERTAAVIDLSRRAPSEMAGMVAFFRDGFAYEADIWGKPVAQRSNALANALGPKFRADLLAVLSLVQSPAARVGCRLGDLSDAPCS